MPPFALVVALLVTQLPSLQQPSPDAPPDGTSTPAALVQAAEAARARQATRERIAALTREAEALKKQSASVLDEVRRLDVERDLQRARETEARQSRRAIAADLVALEARQAALQATLAAERPAIAARLRRLQRLGRVGYARIAWDAGSARDIGRASRLMSYLAKDDGRRLAAYRRTADALTETATQLDARRAEASALETEARRRRTAAEIAYARKQEVLAELQQESGRRERWLAELVAARARLDTSMTERAAAAPAAPAARVPIGTKRRALPWPVAGPVAQRFGRQRDARFGTATVNNGITIAAGNGMPVHAFHPGTVAFAGPFSGFGQLVIVDHGQQAYSLYGYLSAIRVQRGTAVQAGTVVGDVGDAPEGGSSLYFELRIDGRPVDPLQWLERAQ